MKVNAKETYELLEVYYIVKHGVTEDMTFEQIDELNLFPDEWWSREFFYDYPTKVHVLFQALDEEKLIVDTDYYKEHMKGRAPSLEKIARKRKKAITEDDPATKRRFGNRIKRLFFGIIR